MQIDTMPLLIALAINCCLFIAMPAGPPYSYSRIYKDGVKKIFAVKIND